MEKFEDQNPQFVYVQTQNISPRSKTVMLILCIIFGAFGVHDFYGGKIFAAFVKMLTANWFCVGWIIDIIKIASGDYKDGAGRIICRS